MIYLGIDPGKNGGISVIREPDSYHRRDLKIFDIYSEVYSDENLINRIKWCKSKGESIKCVLEKVNAMPGQGVVSMFHFGENFGFIQGVLKSNNISYELVPPQKWKKEFSVTSDKNTSIEVAKRLFPTVDFRATERCKKDHDGKAESLLMAEYARRRL